MSIDDYLKQNIDIDTIRKATEFLGSSHYQDIQKIVGSENYKMAQEALKIRDSLIHKDTLTQIEKMQEAIQASGIYEIAEEQKRQLNQAKESIQRIFGATGKNDE